MNNDSDTNSIDLSKYIIVIIFATIAIALHFIVDYINTNVNTALIEAIQTKTINIDSFDRLSKSNKKRFLEAGGIISFK